MGGVRNRTIALLIAALVLSVGCSPQAEPTTPAAQLGTAPPEEATPTAAPTESEAPDPYAIPEDPADIDKAYVERVVEALNEGVVAATREIGRHQKLTPAAKKALAATHLPSSQQGYLASFREVLKDRKTASQFRSDAESVDVVKVKDVMTASEGCIFTLVLQDTSGLTRRSVRPFSVYYHLRAAKTPSAELNPTPWMVAADAQPRNDGKEFEDPCAAS